MTQGSFDSVKGGVARAAVHRCSLYPMPVGATGCAISPARQGDGA
jgi:hypothetical protein